ncbi:hypothetical protein CC85DRAFT_324733 [Cutaneotrichosporon oleaginosum]|uniref:Uncharacterized protein n=1 Tax=Cutaneotrichosporon oleaginosum TaxID=879819 RepID=A0A0J0XZE5_9TREE|nr:uncharacterized protein CC85DRAFT_324733 [Cutaneotrichosporon oleaginosum]KLT46406.1 hypothetical protein CC85DRAFT_324733 [Cutaneotrichosporon oleaginosum]TXT15224.1 hypothetical protein COLE_01417 [Cutaneotrichosporon oleaginosum]
MSPAKPCATPTPMGVSSPPSLDLSTHTWIDERTYPGIIDNIVRSADRAVHAAFQCTSRHWRKRVDVIRSTHLVLDGELYTDFPRRFSDNRLHNGLKLYFFNELTYHVSSSDSDPDMQISLPAMNVTRTRVLDIRNTVRRPVFDAVAALLPPLDTLRVYAYFELIQPWGLYQSDCFTAFFSQGYTPGTPRNEPWRMRTLVVFSHLGQHALSAYRIAINPFDLPKAVRRLQLELEVEHLVVHLAVPGGEAPLAGFERDVYPIPSLTRATFIFTPATRPWRSPTKARETDTLGDLKAVVEALGVPVTFVGFDLVKGRVNGNIKDLGVTVVDTATYRAQVGEVEWAVFTREAEARPPSYAERERAEKRRRARAGT